MPQCIAAGFSCNINANRLPDDAIDVAHPKAVKPMTKKFASIVACTIALSLIATTAVVGCSSPQPTPNHRANVDSCSNMDVRAAVDRHANSRTNVYKYTHGNTYILTDSHRRCPVYQHADTKPNPNVHANSN